jgi:hypothetical protein
MVDLVLCPPTHNTVEAILFLLTPQAHSVRPAGTCKLQTSSMQSQTDVPVVPQAPRMRHNSTFGMASDSAKRMQGRRAEFMCIAYGSIEPGHQPPNDPNCRCWLPSARPANFELYST